MIRYYTRMAPLIVPHLRDRPLTLTRYPDGITGESFYQKRWTQELPEVDASRIGCVGLSYGGTLRLFTTALDQRIRCAVISGYLNTFESFALGAGNFCGNQIPIGLLRYGEMCDVRC